MGKVLILSAWNPQVFPQITPLSWVLSKGVSSTHPVSKIDGRGSQIFLRAKGLIVNMELVALDDFAPTYVPYLLPYCTRAACASFLPLKMSFP